MDRVGQARSIRNYSWAWASSPAVSTHDLVPPGLPRLGDVEDRDGRRSSSRSVGPEGVLSSHFGSLMLQDATRRC